MSVCLGLMLVSAGELKPNEKARELLHMSDMAVEPRSCDRHASTCREFVVDIRAHLCHSKYERMWLSIPLY